MHRVRFIMVGGFLGAGKTTTLARLARAYTARGSRVGLITNDQAENLVDTSSLRAQGFPVEEVPGACFCCKFGELVDVAGKLEEAERPDVLLAEPVGSCTDLVATVVQPLKDLFGSRFDVAPYAVLFKPSHGLRILRGEPSSGFSPKAAYIFRKQLEEADAIVLNRLDELTPDQVEEVARLVKEQFPGVPLVRMSARTGLGFNALLVLLDQEGAFGRKILDIDYDTYAEGEAELGWLNSSLRLTADAPFDLDAVLRGVVEELKAGLTAAGAEVAHLKVIGLCGGGFGVVNLVSNQTGVEQAQPALARTTEADVIVNARVATDPARLQEQVRRAVEAVCGRLGLRAEQRQAQSLRPGRPVPTHRYTTAVP